jgi:hypothetical protein
MSLHETYQQINNLYRLNIILTDDAIRMLDTISSSFNKTYMTVNSIQELEAKIRKIFPVPTSDKIIPQLNNVSRSFLSLENNLVEAKNITIRYVLTLILSSLKGKGRIDGYDITINILNDPILRALSPALPKFPYGTSLTDGTIIGMTEILSGYMRGTDDYVATVSRSLINLTPIQLDQFGIRFGLQNASIDFNNKFRMFIVQKGLALNKKIIGFMDLVDILSTLK